MLEKGEGLRIEESKWPFLFLLIYIYPFTFPPKHTNYEVNGFPPPNVGVMEEKEKKKTSFVLKWMPLNCKLYLNVTLHIFGSLYDGKVANF